jgi:hypothetical protein
MRVRCVRKQFSPHVEKLTGLREMYASALDLGAEYRILGIYFQKESDVFHSHVSFIILVDIYVLGLFNEAFFEIIDPVIPSDWEYRSDDDIVSIQPSLLYTPGFSEDLFEGDLNVRRQFEELRAMLDPEVVEDGSP